VSRERDPLGKRALFSGAEEKPVVDEPPPQRLPAKRKRGPLDVTVQCSACDTKTTLAAPEILLSHIPVLAWMPWRKRPLYMRCPACNHMGWHSVSRA
jgi:hypothetical protein